MAQLFGISGKRGAGKGSVAVFLQELLPGAIIRQFGHELKLAAAAITGEPIETFLTQEGKAKVLPGFDVTAGQFLQDMGKCMRNGVMDDVWIRSYFKSLPEAPFIINESVRYPNEADTWRKMGGILIRVNGNPLGQQGDGTRDDTHESETALDDYRHFDYTIANNGTLDQLKEAVDRLVNYAQMLPGQYAHITSN